MKFSDTINGSVKKFGKGMIAIFAIKLLLIGGAFVIQSCETDSFEDTQRIEQKLAISKFENLVKQTTPKVQSVVKKRQSLITPKTTLSRELQKQSEEEIIESLKPLVEGTKELLIAYDIDSNELSEDFEDLNDPRIALVGLFALAVESEESSQTAMNFASIFSTSLYAQSTTGGKITKCAVEAIGLDVIYSFASEGFEKAAKKGLKKAIKKVAAKFLGPVGIGIAVAEFAWCMYWS